MPAPQGGDVVAANGLRDHQTVVEPSHISAYPSKKSCIHSKPSLGNVLLRERFQSTWLSLLNGKLLCSGCCWCWQHPDDAIPFWTADSADDTIVTSAAQISTSTVPEEYSTENFESEVTSSHAISSQVPSSSPKRTNYGSSASSPQKLPLKSPKRSESESDESFSVAHSETASDLSDVEGRVKVLNEELQRRKLEVERLKKAKKKKKHDQMREKELALKKQIEAYDSIINQANDDLKDKESSSIPKQPVIKSPRKPSPPSTAVVSTPPTVASEKKDEETTEAIEESLEESISTNFTKSQTSVLDSYKTLSTDAKSHATVTEDIKATVTQEPEAKKPLDAPITDTTHSVDTFSDSSDTIEEEVIESESDASEHIERSHRSEGISQEADEKPKSISISTSKREVDSDARSIHTETSSIASSYSQSKGDSTTTNSYTSTHDDSISKHTTDTGSKPTSDTGSKQSTPVQYTEDFTTSSTATTESVTSNIQTDDDISDHVIDDQSDSSDAAFILKDLDVEKSSKSISSDAEAPVNQNEEKKICEDLLSTFTIGQRVLVGGVQPGTLKFKGRTSFAPGFWGGIELDTNEGYNNGSKDGVVYFTCDDKRGIFAPPEKISVLPDNFVVDNSESLDESIPSDISEHTLTENEESFTQQKSNISDFFDDVMHPEQHSQPKDEQEPSMEKVKDAQDKDTAEDKEVKADQITESLTQSMLVDSLSVMAEITTKQKKPKSIIEPEETSQVPASAKDSTVDTTTKTLLNDAISHMIAIRNKKKQTLEDMQQSDLIGDNEWNKKPTITADDSSFVTNKLIKEISDKSHSVLDDDIYDFSNDDGYIDDEFGFGGKSVQEEEPAAAGGNDLKIDLSRMTAPEPEPFCAVPKTEEQINDLVSKIVDLFWEKRRYGEVWDNPSPPDSYYISPRLSDRSSGSKSDKSSTENTNSSDIFKRLVFDMTSELLTEMYRSEVEEENHWSQDQQLIRRQFSIKHPPTTLDVLKPEVQRHINKLLKTTDADQKSGARQKASKWSSRKRKDNVDLLLVDELKSEEPDWVNYDLDEFTVKNQLADSIFDSLLMETGHVCMTIMKNKR